MENKSDQGALVSAALLCKEPSPLISTVGPFEDTNDPKYSRNHIGFKAIISPDPYDKYLCRNRTLLRIHPARFNGTEGCIGLIGEKEELMNVERLLQISLNNNKTIPLNVIISGY